MIGNGFTSSPSPSSSHHSSGRVAAYASSCLISLLLARCSRIWRTLQHALVALAP